MAGTGTPAVQPDIPRADRQIDLIRFPQAGDELGHKFREQFAYKRLVLIHGETVPLRATMHECVHGEPHNTSHVDATRHHPVRI
ncbi:hypothetical protein GCM10027176_18470 [Actinoallomurus bryophytorum]